MKKWWKRGLYIVFVVLFIGILVEFNSIVLLGVADSEKYIQRNEPFVGNTRVFLNIGSFETYDDLLESFYLGGWAFCETKSSNEGKTIDIILQNEQDIYSVHASAVTRRDVRGAFPGKDIPSGLNGIEIRASTLGVKDGIYDIYVYVRENDENCGLIDTGRKIIKTKERFEELISMPVGETFSAKVSPLVKYSSNIKQKDGALTISGWCFVEGGDTYNQDVYILIQTDEKILAYTARGTSRMDVSSHFGNENYMYSGFDAEIPYENVDAYSICIETGGELLCTNWIDLE